MSKFKSAITVNEKTHTSEGGNQPIKCHASGCGLHGSFSVGTKGEMPFYCRFHFGKDFNKNHQISDVLNLNPSLLQMLDMCSKPESFFKGDRNTSCFVIADQIISEELQEMGLIELFTEKNLLKTRNAIMKHIDDKVAKV